MRANIVDWLSHFMPYNIAALIAPSWFTMVGLAGLVTLIVMIILARRYGIDRGAVASIVLWTYVSAVIAGIVMPMAIDVAQQKLTGGHVHIRWAGMTSFWGYLAGGTAVVLVCREQRIPLARFADIATAPLGFALFLSRLGCFCAGCDFGKVSSVPWAMRFPKGSPAWHAHVDAGWMPASRAESLPVHPTQLYEALLGLVLAVVAIWAIRQTWARDKAGRVVLLGIVIYSIGRIIVETFRGDVGRGIYGGVSSGQIFSICVLAAVALSQLRKQMARVVVIASMLVWFVAPARAQPAPQQPVPQQPVPQQPAPQPYYPAPQPYYPPPQPYYPQQPYYPPQPQQPQQQEQLGPKRNHLEIGLLSGFAAPMNRRNDQVPALAGLSVSAGYLFGPTGIWFDFDSFANTDATHGTALISGSFAGKVGESLFVGGRFGIGTTLVNFHEPAFDDVQATNFRFEATFDYAFRPSWSLWARPFTIDTMTARELGGPITTLQMRVGVAYTFGAHRRAVAMQPQPMQPQPMQPQPMQPQPMQPQPMQPQQPAPAPAPATTQTPAQPATTQARNP